jgi:hypothetical protein
MKISFIVLLGLAATAVLRRRSAAVRHWMLAMAIVCAAATPALELIVPAWSVASFGSLLGPRVSPLTLTVPLPAIRSADGDADVAVQEPIKAAAAMPGVLPLRALWLPP